MRSGMKTLILAVLPALALLLGACGEELDQQRVQQLTSGGNSTLGCSSAPSLTTTFVGGNNQNGNMFSIVAGPGDIRVDSFDGHDPAAVGTPADWEIYFKSGTYIGFEFDPAAWTLAGSATGVPSGGLGASTPLPIAVNLLIPAAGTASFYVTKSDGSVVEYSNGTTEGSVLAGDGSLDVLEGKGVVYPFAGTFTVRNFNGIVHYSTCS